MSRCHFSYQAEQDLNDMYAYGAQFSGMSAARLVQRLQPACRLLTPFPGMTTARDDLRTGMRTSAEGNYLIFYEAANDGIAILRILYGSRNFSSHPFRFL